MEEKDIIIEIAKEFSEYPGPRYINQGENSGEKFYIELLNPKFAKCFKEQKKLKLNLDSSAGYATSFLDEALGELVFDFTEKVVKDVVTIISNEEPEWVDVLQKETYPQWEMRRRKGETPKSSEEHEVYYLDTTDNVVKRRNR